MTDTAQNDGGPAFPCSNEQLHSGHAAPGMSLRDFIAVHALGGMLSNGAQITVTDPALSPQRVMANAAYTLADAMLEARA